MTTPNTVPTFATSGSVVTTKIGAYSAGNSVTVQADGKILVAGYGTQGSTDHIFALTRYNSDGSLDTTFDTDGIVTTKVDSSSNGQSVTIQAGGKILVTGYGTDSTGTSEIVLTRYNPNGSLDTTFDADGIVTTKVGKGSEGKGVAVQADGKILVAGWAIPSTISYPSGDFALIRYNPNGSLDTTFNTDGVATNNVGSNSYGQSVTIQADGKILVAGYSNAGAFVLMRYNSDGSLDTTFDADGMVTTKLTGTNYTDQESVTVQADGKILVAGYDTDSTGHPFIALMRYNPNGSLDTTFDADGIVTTKVGSYSISQSVTMQADGKILVGGASVIDGNTMGFTLPRYNSDGSVDTTFDTDGIVRYNFGASSTQGQSVALQADGKILVTGSVTGTGTGSIALIRYNSNGSLDTSFNPVSSVTTGSNTEVVMAPTLYVIDAELSALNSYANAHLTLQRHGGPNLADVFGITYKSPIYFDNGVLSYSGTSIGNVTQSNGKLDLTFNSNATQEVVTTTLRSLTYTNVGNGASEKITLDWTFDDGNIGSQGTVTGTSIVNITDLTPPSVSSFSPTSSATNVALNSDIVLTFSEAIQRGTGNIALKNSLGTVIATYDAATSTNLNITGNTLTINPSSDLAFSTRYTVEFANGSVKDLSGNAYSGTSSYQFTTKNPNSLPTGLVSISGTATQGQVLAASNSLADLDGLGTISYQWLSGGSVIAGATKGNYTLTESDIGKNISVKASYTDLQGTAENASSDPTALVVQATNHAPTGSVTILGTAQQGQTLTVSGNVNDVDGMGAITGQWFRDGIAVVGATDASYVLTQTDVGKSISATANYIDGLGKLESVLSSAVKIANVNDAPTGSVSISGMTTQGQVLTASNSLADLDGLGVISYQWLNSGIPINSANQATYTLTAPDAGKTISVKASYTDGFGRVENVISNQTPSITNVNDLPTGSVSIAGNAKEGQILTASNTLADADGLGTISYQWSNNGSVISGADKATYKLTSTDVGKTISVQANYTDLQGTSESANSESTAAISSIKATKGNDLLLGTAKNNTLSALAGDDTLIGGFGSDKLTGGKGADTFTFTSIDDSGITTKSRDTITDFKHSEGDKIDLSGLGFSFIGNDAFSSTDATGQLRFDAKTHILYVSTNVDNSPEFSILLSGVRSLVADDLILSSQS